MAYKICPTWVGYLLLSPLRKVLENPDKILGSFVREGMTILELGCGMGYFTLPMARMVGSRGRVIAVDIQPKMLSALRRRAQKAGLFERIDLRQAESGSVGVEDLSGKVAFAVALHMVHEVFDRASFFMGIWNALTPNGGFLIIEPKGHVSQSQLEQTLSVAEKAGFKMQKSINRLGGRGALLIKPEK
jgi:ubiquinone/menaquinone biosynthesis C-methylase UbiE